MESSDSQTQEDDLNQEPHHTIKRHRIARFTLFPPLVLDSSFGFSRDKDLCFEEAPDAANDDLFAFSPISQKFHQIISLGSMPSLYLFNGKAMRTH